VLVVLLQAAEAVLETLLAVAQVAQAAVVLVLQMELEKAE
jgi:hypothetical protein